MANLNIGLNAGFAGEFKLTAKKVLMKDGQPVLDDNGDYIFIGERELAEFPNLILDSGLEQIAKGYIFQGCAVGSGTSTPDVSQTALDNLVAVTTTLNSNSASKNTTTAPYYVAYVTVWRFGVEVAAGNLSEVCMASGINTFNKTIDGLWCRSLIKDGNGNPTTITVLPDEVLDVAYTLRLYIPTQDVTGVIKIGADDYNYTLRAAYMSGWYIDNYLYLNETSYVTGRGFAGGISDITAFPVGSENAYTNNKYIPPYVANSHQRTYRFDFGLNSGSQPIRSVAFSLTTATGQSFVNFQAEFSRVSDGAAIPKDGTKILSLNLTLNWGRYAA